MPSSSDRAQQLRDRRDELKAELAKVERPATGLLGRTLSPLRQAQLPLRRRGRRRSRPVVVADARGRRQDGHDG